eukprot:3609992-Pleurochrysis_carterae.AAC.1
MCTTAHALDATACASLAHALIPALQDWTDTSARARATFSSARVRAHARVYAHCMGWLFQLRARASTRAYAR